MCVNGDVCHIQAEAIKRTSPPTVNSYEFGCFVDGQMGKIPEGQKCKAIDCAEFTELPSISHATVKGATTFGEVITVAADEGYSLDGNSHAPTSFEIRCQASGEFGPLGQEFERISCDVPNYRFVDSMKLIEATSGKSFAQVGSSFASNGDKIEARFGDRVKYTCMKGYHATKEQYADPEDPQAFELECRLDGELTAEEGTADMCAPVACHVHEAPDTDFITHTGKQCVGTEKDLLRNFEGDADQCMQKCRALEGCAGFVRVNTGSSKSDGKCFFRGGKLKEPMKTRLGDQRDCYEFNQIEHDLPLLATNEMLPLVRTYGEMQSMHCIYGYSLDGREDGETDFEEECLADGEVSHEHHCEDIDYCIDNKCGDHGKCVDDLLHYSCICDKGFKVAMLDGSKETCEQIDECKTFDGHDRCSGEGKWGECEDGIVGYTCKCSEGYHNSNTDGGFDCCLPKACHDPEPVSFAHKKNGRKLVYKDVLDYNCVTGYSLDGQFDGEIGFSVECQANGETTVPKTCKPIECGDVKKVEHAEADMTSLVFPEEATYTCEDGFTVTGSPVGSNEFVVSCESSGAITDTAECLRVSCGAAPSAPNAQASRSPKFFGDEVAYHCKQGFTTTGQVDGAKEFTAKCNQEGDFEGVSQCSPVKCGALQKINHAFYSHIDHWYPEQSQVVCHTGYTLDSQADGESTFIAKCGSDGEFSGIKKCQPVSCGAPNPTSGADTSHDTEKFFEETAEWECKEGYTVDGTSHGGTTFKKQCLAGGSWGTSTPHDCTDINFCVDDPCSANGLCNDTGVGEVDPGYECTCFDGYQITKDAKGNPTCTEDDCADDPCGKGGTCTDYSKQEAGLYSCDCKGGYKLVEEVKGKPTCERVDCGILAKVDNVELDPDGMPQLRVRSWDGEDPKIDTFTSLPILNSFDTARYTCADGYSTDRTTHSESKTFEVTCESRGLYNPTLAGTRFCVAIKCGSTFIPDVAHTVVVDAWKGYFYGDHVTIDCEEGYTIGGGIHDKTSFTLECLADGTFGDAYEICSPVVCVVEDIQFAIASHEGMVNYGKAVAYQCDQGYYLGGVVSTSTIAFTGTCGADGNLAFSPEHVECLPCNCGGLPAVSNAELFVKKSVAQTTTEVVGTNPKGSVVKKQPGDHHDGLENYEIMRTDATVTYGESVLVKCDSGYTVGGIAGGRDHYEVICGASGSFSEGMPFHGSCRGPTYAVAGEATDSTSESLKLEDTKISFYRAGDTTAIEKAQTNSLGRYTTSLPEGTYVMETEKSGYIASQRNLTVKGIIQLGQGADVDLSAVLNEGEFRVVLRWGERSRDLDSYVYFDKDTSERSWFGNVGSTQVGSVSGVNSILDRDDQYSYGPETTTITGVGKCEDSCIVKFHVDNYTPEDGKLGDSEGQVDVLVGSGTLKSYRIPKSAGDDQGRTIFTLDASNGKIYDGDYTYGPYIYNSWSRTGTVDWSASMDRDGWSKVPAGAVLYALGASDLEHLHQVSSARYFEVQPVNIGHIDVHVEWGAKLHDGEWALCPEGTYIRGIYRQGSKFDGTHGESGGWQLQKAMCSRFSGITTWGECFDVNIFEKSGLDAAKCPVASSGIPSAMVGLKAEHRDSNDALDALHTAKCCQFPMDLVKVPEGKLCRKHWSCSWDAMAPPVAAAIGPATYSYY